MKIVHISDIHISGTPILGFDPIANFKSCLAHVAEFQGDADIVVITGDLTHKGEAENYQRLRSMLETSALNGKLTPRLLVGNHDSRDNFVATFGGEMRDENGFIQWTEDTDAGLFVYLDTSEPGTHEGHYCEKRQAWLRGVLTEAENVGKPAWLFMHHNPIAVEVANADAIGIVQQAAFHDILNRFGDTIRHIFFGHCHFTLSGQVCGIAFSAPRSTNHVCWPDFSGIVERMGYGAFSPNYNVCFISSTGTVVHSIDFLDENKVRWAT